MQVEGDKIEGVLKDLTVGNVGGNIAVLEAEIRQLFGSTSGERIVKVEFVPFIHRATEVNRRPEPFELSILLCKHSKFQTLRSQVVKLARDKYGYADEDLLEEDVHLVEIYGQKVRFPCINYSLHTMIIGSHISSLTLSV